MSAIIRHKIAYAHYAHRCRAVPAEQIWVCGRQSPQGIYNNIAKGFNASRAQICPREPTLFDSPMAKHGIINGISGALLPGNTATRMQLAKMAEIMRDLMIDSGVITKAS